MRTVPYDHQLHRSVVLIVASWWVCGALILISGIYPAFRVNPAIVEEQWSQIVLGLLLNLGSGIIVCSQFPWKNVQVSWGMELLGWPMLTGAWVLYTLFVLGSGPWWYPVTLGVGFALGATLNFFEIWQYARTTRRNIAELEARGGRDA